VPLSDQTSASDPAKGDPAKQGDGSNFNRPLRPIPKPEIKIASEKEEIKIQTADSKPRAEAIARPNTLASDNAPQKPDLNPKQADEVVRQVLDRIDALAASRSGRKVTIHLDPKEFGSITLVVGRRGGEVDAEIYASNDRVRQALELNRPNLAAGLDQRGIQLSSMTVGSQLPHGSGRQEQELHDMARHQHQNLSRFEKTETTTLSIDAIRGLARKTSGVDLWT
jgi:flagellar hook-length control protein FliK